VTGLVRYGRYNVPLRRLLQMIGLQPLLRRPTPHCILSRTLLWLLLALLGAALVTEPAATRASRLTVREALTYL
jgi:hypothetical protein